MHDDPALRERVLEVLRTALEAFSEPDHAPSSISPLATITESCPPPHTGHTREIRLYCLEWSGEGAQLLCLVALPLPDPDHPASSTPPMRDWCAFALERLRRRGEPVEPERPDTGEPEGNEHRDTGEPEVIECIDADEPLTGRRLIESWDDLEGLRPGELALVPLPSPLAESIWAWREMDRGHSVVGPLARGVDRLLLGMSRTDWIDMVGGAGQVVDALGRALRAAGRARAQPPTRH